MTNALSSLSRSWTQLEQLRAPLSALLSRARTTGRVGLHAGAFLPAWVGSMTLDEVDRFFFKNNVAGSLELHTRVLKDPAKRAALARAEWEDLLTLPVFVACALADVRRIRSKEREGQQRLPVAPRDDFPYPDYYLNDFHNQLNGGLSLRAALTYEWQIRLLFIGANRLMRQGVIDEIPEGDHLDVLDVACGPATWIHQAWLQNRRHRYTGIDLSPSYLQAARLMRRKLELRQMNAEQLAPEWTGRFGLVTCIWLFHELPSEARERVAAEMARVLQPGGTLLFMDSIQAEEASEGERATFKNFETHFNEPHYVDYTQMDLPALFARHGLRVVKKERWFLSKLLVLRKETPDTLPSPG